MGSANDSHRQHDTPPQGTTYKIIKSSVGVHVDFGDFRTQLQQKKAEVPKNLQKAMDLEIICPMGVDRLTLVLRFPHLTVLPWFCIASGIWLEMSDGRHRLTRLEKPYGR